MQSTLIAECIANLINVDYVDFYYNSLEAGHEIHQLTITVHQAKYRKVIWSYINAYLLQRKHLHQRSI